MSYQLILQHLNDIELQKARQLYTGLEQTLGFLDRSEYLHRLEGAIQRAFRLLKEMLAKDKLSHADVVFKECGAFFHSTHLAELRELGYLKSNNQPFTQDEREALLRQQAELEENRRKCLLELQMCMENRFLQVNHVFSISLSSFLSVEEVNREKSQFVQLWVEKNLKTNTPDFEQASAIASVNGNIQVVARAGSGKTTTLIQRAIFLQRHCGIAPQEMLLLAFNRKAALDMQEKLRQGLLDEAPQAMTFHALAYAIVHPEESPLFDEPEGAQRKSSALQSIIDSFIRSAEGHGKVRNVMMTHFRADWERIVLEGYDRSPRELLAYKRALPKEGLDGTPFKSYGEKLIGDFLFEHDIPYRYERNFNWNGINYRPDFTIFKEAEGGVVIEYFGLTGDADYDEMSHLKRHFWANKDNWSFLEFGPRDIKPETDFLSLLKSNLEAQDIVCKKLSEDEIWHRVKDRAIDRFTKVIVSFVARCRKSCFTIEQLRQHISEFNYSDDSEFAFLQLAAEIYESYLEQLAAAGEDDFDGLMQKAATLISQGQTTFVRKSGTGNLRNLKYVFIDEYQDFSTLFQQLVQAIKAQAPQVQFFCVGDDWQAINGFAGSDLEFYRNFKDYFEMPEKIVVPTNYRSAKKIVNAGNALMQGLGESARSSGLYGDGYVAYADLGGFQPTEIEEAEHPNDKITPAVLRLVCNYVKQHKSVALLSRTNTIPWYTGTKSSLEDFLKKIRSYLPEYQEKLVEISTAHKYKGQQKDVVIILDATVRRYPLIHPDFVFTKIFGDSVQTIMEEERRLFYVALTRAKKEMVIITERPNTSPFLEEVLQRQDIPNLRWQNFSQVLGSIERIIVRVKNQSNTYHTGGTFAIKDLLKSHDYRWEHHNRAWRRTIDAANFSQDGFISNTIWLKHADGVEIVMSDDHDRVFARYLVNGGKPHFAA